MRLTDNQWSGFSFPLPNVRGEVVLSSKKDRIVAELKLSAGEVIENFKASVVKGKIIKINKLEANLNVAPILEMSGMNIKGVKLHDTKIHVSGAIRLANRPILNLKFQSADNIRYTFLGVPIDMRPWELSVAGR